MLTIIVMKPENESLHKIIYNLKRIKTIVKQTHRDV